MVNAWKITAIIFIILFLSETIFWVWMIKIGIEETAKDTECYWGVCEDYPQAERIGDVCYCYDYDVLGELQLADTEIMK